MPLSTYLDEKTLRWLTLGEAYPTTPTLYVALYTTTPSKSSAGVEVAGNNYSRVAAPNWQLVSVTPRLVRNTSIVLYPLPNPAAWGTVVGFGLHDALAGGNLLFYAPVAASLVTVANQPVLFQIGALQIAGQ